MTTKQLWSYFLSKQVCARRGSGRDFIWVSKADFAVVRTDFKEEINLLHKEKSYRSMAY